MIGSLLRVAKNVFLRGSAALGVEGALRDSRWRERRLLILCYHGVSLADEHLWSDLYVTRDHLESRFQLLREGGYNVMPFAEAVARLYDGTLPPRSVTITFDDGFADFYLQAHSLIRELELPTLVYLTTYYANDQRPVFDPLYSYLLWKGRGKSVRLPAPVAGTVTLPDSRAARDELHGRIRSHGLREGWSAEEKDRLADELAGQIGFDLDRLRALRVFYVMSPAELSALDRRFVDIQLHTHRHRTPRDEGLFTREVVDNRAAIRALLPDRDDPVHFCYPSGDYDLRFLPWLRSMGVTSATTCEHGLASPRNDPLLLPRFLDSMHVPEHVFRSWLAGTAAFIPRRA